MSITPAAGLTFGGGGGKPACASAWVAANAHTIANTVLTELLPSRKES